MNNTKAYKNYREVNMDSNGMGYERYYKSPLTRAYQYEYALYKVISDLFWSVKPRSRSIGSLKMYFRDLPCERKGGEKKKTQEDLLEEVRALVERDVVGNVKFPMMSSCSAEAKTITEKGGTHKLVFTDGLYGFCLRIDGAEKGHPRRIMVTNMPGDRQKGGKLARHILEEEMENSA